MVISTALSAAALASPRTSNNTSKPSVITPDDGGPSYLYGTQTGDATFFAPVSSSIYINMHNILIAFQGSWSVWYFQ